MPFGLLIFVYDELRKLGVRCCPGSECGDQGPGAGGAGTASEQLALTFDLQALKPPLIHTSEPLVPVTHVPQP